MPNLTLHDVGKACGLSASTVSLALRGDGRIHWKTRERVQEVAKKLGYRPNAAAAALVAGRHHQPTHDREIAVVTGCLPAQFSEYAPRWLMEACRNRGYAVRRVEMGTEQNIPKVIAQLYFEGVDGVILDRIWVAGLDLFQYDWSAFAVTVHRRTRHLRDYDLVTPDAVQSMHQLWQEVRSRGYRRIGVLLCRHQPMMIDDELREGALAFCHSQAGASETILPPYLGDHDDNRGIVAWVKRHKPDALIGFHDGHFYVVKEHFEIPGKIAFASLHGSDDNPAIAAMYERAPVLAAMCVDHLDQLIRYRQLGKREFPRQILIGNGWRPGATLPEKGR